MRSLLIGNGFSRDFESESFDYASLFEKADLDQRVRDVFNSFETSNFEEILNYLDITKRVATALDPEINIADYEGAAADVRSRLIQTINDLHPDPPYRHDDDRKPPKLWFKKFNNVFSVNYDLLAYWTNVKQEPKDRLIDGFGGGSRLVWGPNRSSQTFHNLHGGLHLYADNGQICKLRCEESNIREKATQNLTDGIYPIFVCEGDADKKLTSIKSNEYLSFCYDKLISLEGELHIFGCSFLQDDHILEAIRASKVTRVVNYRFGETKLQFLQSRTNKEVMEHDALSPWRNQHALIAYLAGT